jgi:hypothetical protein
MKGKRRSGKHSNIHNTLPPFKLVHGGEQTLPKLSEGQIGEYSIKVEISSQLDPRRLHDEVTMLFAGIGSLVDLVKCRNCRILMSLK